MNALALSECPVTLESEPFDLIALCSADNAIEFKNNDGTRHVFTPDETKGYFQFSMGSGFPEGTSMYGLAMHPNVVAASYKTLMEKPLDYEHRKNANNPELQHDHFLGAIVAARFPDAPSSNGWKITDRPTPSITGVAVFWKAAIGLKKILGDHLTGRHAWSVSYDAHWSQGDANESDEATLARTSGFAVKIPDGEKPIMDHSPNDFLAAGYEYIPGSKAPADLIKTFNTKASPMRVDKNWKGRKVTLLMNQEVGSVHFAGLGLVRYGAEPTAKIKQVVASATDPMAESIEEMRQVVGQFLTGKIVSLKS